MSDLLFSYWLLSFYFSRVSHSGVAELTFSFDSDSFFNSASYFCTLLGFDSVSYVHRNGENSWVFWLSSPSSTEWHTVGFSFSRFLEEVFWPSWSYFVPGKTRQGYETLGKKKAELEVRFHEKGMWAHEGFCARQGWVEVWGSQVNGEPGELSWNHLTFTLPRYLRWQRVFFCPFILEANRLLLFLTAVGSWFP